MDSKIIEMTRGFIKELRSEMNTVNNSDLFVISITSEGSRAGSVEISVAMYDSVMAGSLAKDRYPNAYKVAEELFSLACSEYNGIQGIQIMLSFCNPVIIRTKKGLRIGGMGE